jgi:hypothetical protein
VGLAAAIHPPLQHRDPPPLGEIAVDDGSLLSIRRRGHPTFGVTFGAFASPLDDLLQPLQ